ncbi:MAG: NAD-dependent epimerase/dehydratase family protein [Candidatus Aenigmarchaeota archaeon]|nr:NAD-dependent epimerase/dehydratase family protein [Candidatus Aenigmarchaeota archaeon]
METVVVTGAAGFIGSHVVDRLLSMDMLVVGIDAFTDNYPTERKEANLKEALQNPNFMLVRGDLNDLDLKATLKGIPYVIHLAAQPGVRGGWEADYEIYRRNNILATQKLLAAAKGVKKFVFASSSSVYGNAPYPTKEETPLNPLSPYGRTKVEGEKLCAASGLPVLVFRYFTVFGPRQRPDMAISRFIKSIYDGEPIDIYGDGEQKRDFTYVGDVAAVTAKSLLTEETGTFNIAGKNIVVINRVVEDLVKIAEMQADLRYLPTQRGDVDHTGADISKAITQLKYNPEVRLFDGLKKQVAWYQREILGREPTQPKYWKPY